MFGYNFVVLVELGDLERGFNKQSVSKLIFVVVSFKLHNIIIVTVY